MGNQERQQTVGKRRGFREDPLSTFLLVGAAVLALMYILETRQRAGLDVQEAQAVAIAGLAGFTTPDCTVGAAGGRGEILVVSCKQEPLERVIAGVTTGLSEFSDVAGFKRVYLAGQDNTGSSDYRMCDLTSDFKLDLEKCSEPKGRSKDDAQMVVGVVGVK